MGRLMDRVMAPIDPTADDAHDRIMAELAIIRPHCHWTQGTWEEIGLRWNELQNVPKHINILSNYLIRAYLSEKRVPS